MNAKPYTPPSLSELLAEVLGSDFMTMMKPLPNPKQTAKHELIGSILSKEEAMNIIPNGARYDELVDMSIAELHQLEVETTDKKYYYDNGKMY